MNTTLLEEARKKALLLGHDQSLTPKTISEVNERLIGHFVDNRCPVLAELLLTYYKHPTNLSPIHTANILINNHATDAKRTKMPIKDPFGTNLYKGIRLEPDTWNLICVGFSNVYRYDIFLTPYNHKGVGIEILTYSYDTGMHTSNQNDLPRWFAVDIISKDPSILLEIKE